MSRFGQGGIFICILARGRADDFCDPAVKVPKLELAGRWTRRLLVLWLSQARLRTGAAPLAAPRQCCPSRASLGVQIPEKPAKKL